jgi:hypothetical protein
MESVLLADCSEYFLRIVKTADYNWLIEVIIHRGNRQVNLDYIHQYILSTAY